MTTARTVRFDDELYELIEVTAHTDERSLNGQIVWLIRAGLELRDIHRSQQASGHPGQEVSR